MPLTREHEELSMCIEQLHLEFNGKGYYSGYPGLLARYATCSLETETAVIGDFGVETNYAKNGAKEADAGRDALNQIRSSFTQLVQIIEEGISCDGHGYKQPETNRSNFQDMMHKNISTIYNFLVYDTSEKQSLDRVQEKCLSGFNNLVIYYNNTFPDKPVEQQKLHFKEKEQVGGLTPAATPTLNNRETSTNKREASK
jgi:hypothetical protein